MLRRQLQSLVVRTLSCVAGATAVPLLVALVPDLKTHPPSLSTTSTIRPAGKRMPTLSELIGAAGGGQPESVIFGGWFGVSRSRDFTYDQLRSLSRGYNHSLIRRRIELIWAQSYAVRASDNSAERQRR